MDDAFETQEYKGYRIAIDIDQSPLSPMKDWDMLGQEAVLNGREAMRGEADLYPSDDDLCDDEGHERTLSEYLQAEHSAVVIVPYKLHDYGSQGMRLEEVDDAEITPDGAFFLTAEGLKSEYGDEPEAELKVYRCILADMEVQNQYYRGEVFGYVIEDSQGRELDDSCWGFYGYDFERNGLLESARNVIDVLVSEEEERQKLIAQGLCPVCKKVPMYPLRHVVTGTRYADYDGSYSDESFKADGEGEYLCPECQTVLARSRADADAFIRAGERHA